jgi:lipid-binding SYLF domain-containing protein
MRGFASIGFFLIAIMCCGGAALAADDPAERAKIDKDATGALNQLYESVPGSQDLAQKAKGMLVFPSVYKAGIGVGGEYGRGALRVKNRTEGYYSTAGASFGFQLGAQARSLVFMFMTPQALENFKNSQGWDVGGDASVALVKTGASGKVDLASAGKPIVAFVYGNTGLMYNLSLEGTKVSKLDLGQPGEATGSSRR